MMLSHAATVRGTGCREMMINDVSRTNFSAPATRSLFIELPEGDLEARQDEVGRLNVCLYGTRDAAKGWQQTLSKHLVSIRFRRGVGHPAVFYHPKREIKTLVYGDYYASSGESTDVEWLEYEFGKRYKIKTRRARPVKGNGIR